MAPGGPAGVEAGKSTLPAPEDKRLDRLFEYTKFHIGIYLSIGGGIIAILGSEKSEFIRSLIGWPWALLVGLVCMFAAGIAGGLIASTCAQAETFDEVWIGKKKLGPYTWEWGFKGREWAFIEHMAFWVGLCFIAASVLSSTSVYNFLWKTAPPVMDCVYL